MRPEATRRVVIVAGAGALAGAACGRRRREPVFDTAHQTSLGAGARFGWATLDLADGKWSFVNRTARLPVCSTFKWLLAAAVLARVDAGRDRLDRPVPFGPGDLLDNAPVARAALAAAGGASARLTVDALCEAAVTVSDNTAADLLLRTVGGPAALTAWLRGIGDGVTRLDRPEPALNHSPRGEERDTTTAEAAVENLHRLLYGPVLRPPSRKRLLGWMLACRTGAHRLSAGVPPGWRVAHKTGTWSLGRVDAAGDGGAAGDVGALLPPAGAPVLAAVLVAGSRRPEADVERFMALIARDAVTDALTRREAHARA